ncbi:MAG: sulfotransferase [Phycisphaeraceae bacterium]
MNHHSNDLVRAFIVGCPRSGTTLLQSLLAAHSKVISFPETQFFRRLEPSKPLFRKLKVIGTRAARARMIRFLGEMDADDLLPMVPRYAVLKTQYIRAFVAILDTLARRGDKDCWIEKSPKHLDQIPLITRTVANCRFIHLLREGSASVASLIDASRKYGGAWHGPTTIDGCIAEYNHSVEVSRRYIGTKYHCFVRYESVVQQTDVELERIFDFLGITMEPDLAKRQSEVAAKLIRPEEKWKSNVQAGGVFAVASKFESLFTEQERSYVQSRLADASAFPAN